MSVLSELLEELLETKSININQLSKMSGISRATLHHYVHGRRPVQKQEHIDAIASALTLSPSEMEKVKSAFLIETIGEQLYSQRLAIYSFFRNLNSNRIRENTDLNTVEISEAQTDKKRESAAYDQKPEVVSAIYNVLRESVQQHDSVMLYADPTSASLKSILLSPAWNFSTVDFKHIFRLESVNYKRNNNNLDIIEAVVNYATAIQKYHPMFFYEAYSDADSVFQLTEFIASEHEVIQFSRDCNHAIRHTEKSIIDMFRNIFKGMQNKCHSLGRAVSYKIGVQYDVYRICDELFNESRDIESGREEELLLAVSGGVALNNYWTSEMTKTYISRDIDDENASEYSYDRPHVFGEMTGNINVISVMRKDALKSFLKNGKIVGFPDEMLNMPVRKEDRKLIANNMIQQIQKGEATIALIDLDKMPLQENWGVIALKERTHLYNYSHMNMYCIPVYERSFSFAVHDYFMDLIRNESTTRDSDAVEQIREWIDKYLS